MSSSTAEDRSHTGLPPEQVRRRLRASLAEGNARLESARLLFDRHRDGDALLMAGAALQVVAQAIQEAAGLEATLPEADSPPLAIGGETPRPTPSGPDGNGLLEAIRTSPLLSPGLRDSLHTLLRERLERDPRLLAGGAPERGEANTTLTRTHRLLRELEATLEPQLFTPPQRQLRRITRLASRIGGAALLVVALLLLTRTIQESRNELTIEGEDLVDRVVSAPPGVTIETQRGNWGLSGRRQLYVKANAADQAFEFALEVPETGRYRLSLYPSRANNYGIVRFTLDGTPVGRELDLYAKKVSAAGETPLGQRQLEAGRHILRVQVVGRHSRSRNFQFGIDRLVLHRER